MTKLSNVYFGFSRVSLREAADAASIVSSIGWRVEVDGAFDCTGIGAVSRLSASSGLTTTRKAVADGSCC